MKVLSERKSKRWRADESVAKRSVCGLRVWRRVGESGAPLGSLGGRSFSYPRQLRDGEDRTSKSPAKDKSAYLGTAIFAVTSPVSVDATLRMPSVPAVSRWSPSALKTRLLQLPLWRRVRHTVSMVPWPLVLGALALAFRLGLDGRDGRRWSCTCPDARPSATTGELVCIASVKRSEARGKVQMESNVRSMNPEGTSRISDMKSRARGTYCCS